MTILKFKRNVYFDFLTLKLYFFDPSIFKKFNRDLKLYFFYFLVSSLREERERLAEFRL